MTLTYNPATNLIIVDAYTEGTPCNFTDIYNADRAGTLKLLDGTIDADPDTFSLDRAVRPTNDCAVILTITCTARVGATCDIDGEDAWGNAISENGIDISSGSATTTEYFSVVDAAGITVDGMTNGDDFDIDQGQWGVVWKLGDDQFLFDAKLLIGDGTVAWFADEGKMVTFDNVTTGVWQYNIYVNNNATFRLGKLEDATDKSTSTGCTLHINSGYHTNIIDCLGGSELYLYSCMIEANSSHIYNIYRPRANSRIWNTILSFCRIAEPQAGDYYNIYTAKSSYALAGVVGGTFDDIILTEAQYYALLTYGVSTYTNIKAYNCIGIVLLDVANGARYLINCETDNWQIWFVKTGPVYRQYTFDMKVVDGTGTGISGATVSMDDTNGSNIFSESTDGSGDIATQTVTYKTYDRAGGLPGLTDAEVTLSPHTVTISKAGHAKREIIYTIDQKRVEVEKLAGIPIAIEYRRRRVPSEVSGMIEL